MIEGIYGSQDLPAMTLFLKLPDHYSVLCLHRSSTQFRTQRWERNRSRVASMIQPFQADPAHTQEFRSTYELCPNAYPRSSNTMER